MRRLRPLLVTLSLAAWGCGRVGFDAIDGDARSGDAVAALCPQPGAFFCDGFESPTFDAWTSRNGGVVQTTSLVHTGAGALVATTDATLQIADVVSAFTPIGSGEVHARGWFYLPSGYPIFKFNLFGLYGSTGAVIVADQGKLNVFNDGPPAVTLYTNADVPRDRWFCLEVHLTISPTNGTGALNLDGTQLGEMTGWNTVPAAGGYNKLLAGLPFLFPTQDPATTLFLDDVVVGSQPIGCL